MQRAAVPGVSIGGCEVDGNLVERGRESIIKDIIESVWISKGIYLASYNITNDSVQASLKYAMDKLSDQR